MAESPLPMPADDISFSGAAKPSPLLHLGHPDAHIPMYVPPESASAKPTAPKILIFVILAVIAAFAGQVFEHIGAQARTPNVALPWVLPFVLLLAGIAAMPFIARHFWEKHYHHVALALAAVVTLYYLFFRTVEGVPVGAGFFQSRAGPSMARSFGDYISFIFLLGSLFTVSGGILIRVRRKATPAVNATLLLAGAVLANMFGTTGAAMLLIRPYLRINRGHIRPFHIVFFIFMVANIGGCLTPIGDPPLFLGFLKGVPFWWVLENCWPMWALAVALLLVVFLVLDIRAQRGEQRAPHDPNDLGPPISLFGGANLLLVFSILAGVLLHDQFNARWETLHIPFFEHLPLRELIMTAAIAISLWITPQRIHVENVFNFAPIREVALLFIGIFATMVPALNYLAYHAHDPALEKALNTPGQFYFSSGTLSSVLDNAPTYVTFLETELGKLDKNTVLVAQEIANAPGKAAPDQVDFDRLRVLNAQRYQADPALEQADKKHLIEAFAALDFYHHDAVRNGTLSPSQVEVGFLLGDEKLEWYIIAISLGSVFFGAMTYIGNGPNFMVKSIADNAGVKCPSFFGYIFMYSLPVLLPVLVTVWWIFLRPHGGG